MKAYTDFAYIYDRLMEDVNYREWADYIEGIFKRYDKTPSLILDLGCGTGSFCVEMAMRGYSPIGVDISEEMLSCARQKAENSCGDILFLNQDMTRFELYGTVDAIVCLMDSLNYITVKNDVKRMFKLVNNYLNPGGLFIFDINSPYKFENILKDNVFYSVDDDITYIWQNRYDIKTKICEFDLTFFVREGEYYKRYDEIHDERAYSINELEDIIKHSGLEMLNIFDGLTLNAPSAKSERLFFVCRRKMT